MGLPSVSRDEKRPAGLRRLGGAGTNAERAERIVRMSLAGYPAVRLEGLARELAARLVELPAGCEQARALSALLAALGAELAERRKADTGSVA